MQREFKLEMTKEEMETLLFLLQKYKKRENMEKIKREIIDEMATEEENFLRDELNFIEYIQDILKQELKIGDYKE